MTALQNTWSRFVVLLAAVCGLAAPITLLSASPAAADLRFCNRTPGKVYVAVGHRDKDGWVSEGWFNFEPNVCDALLPGALTSRYYYVYVIDETSDGEGSGKAFLCTTPSKMFTIRGYERCAERGFEAKGFMEIDTGDHQSWTIEFADIPAKGSAAR